MKINFNQSSLVEAISTALPCVSGKSTIASVEGVLIDCTGENAVIVAYDLEKGIRIEFDAEIIEAGACIINAQSLNSIIRLMPTGQILLEVNETWRAKLSSGNSEFEINAMSPREYPTLPDISNRKGFNIKQADMRNMISQTLFAVAQNDGRPTFNGALFKLEGNRITTVGCDTFRLAIREKVCELENTSDEELNTSFIVPGRTLSEVLKLLNEPEEMVSINISRKQVIFRFDKKNIVFFSRLIEGEYIDYERIIPKNSKIFVNIDTESFQRALERASVVTDEAAGKNKSSARCHFYDNRLEITSVSANGKVRDEVATSHEGDEIEIGFNCRYLTEALKASQCEKLKLSMSTPYISMIIEPLEADPNDHFTFLVLPFKMLK
ncbi:MAG: DNA polymerase III subunit beta [Clostridiales bacterium]|nr:DNA polymerase III subunit beta [Clostridiales bacterium]